MAEAVLIEWKGGNRLAGERVRGSEMELVGDILTKQVPRPRSSHL